MQKFLLSYFNLKGIPNGNLSIRCPFHDDVNSSASINFKKGVFHCFSSTCVGGLSLKQLYERLQDMQKEKLKGDKIKKSIKKKLNDTPELEVNLYERSEEYLTSRGLNAKRILEDYDPVYAEPCDQYILDGERCTFYGTLVFESVDGYITGRDLLFELEGRPKYVNQEGPRSLFWISKDPDPNNKVVFLTEGIFDALSLYELGITNVVSLNGSELPKDISDKVAFDFRGMTVLILFDNDPAGFIGAKNVAGKLKQYEVDHAIVELPRILGNDINEALVNKKDKLKVWTNQVLEKYYPNDKRYVDKLYRSEEMGSLNLLPTGITALDKMLTGGFKDGGHIIAGETGVGKTSLVVYLAIQAAMKYDKRSMINSCEISKRQTWARIASYFSEHSWRELEEDPHLLEEDAYELVKQVSDKIVVVNGWPLNRIVQESDNYDIIIIDYIQRVREVYSGEESASRHLINNYVSRMTDLGALKGKICIMISSLDRASYSNPNAFGLKESGSLEYMGTTVSRITPLTGIKGGTTFVWNVQKNNRGDTGRVKVYGVDLGHSDFSTTTSNVAGVTEDGE